MHRAVVARTSSKRTVGVIAAIARLRALLESSDGDAAESFVELEGTLAGVCDKPRLAALSAAISEFDFVGARKTLDEIAKEYGANWEWPQ
jgi:hypothetical protein